MATQQRIVILSDIHIGDNSPTCWYQQSYHEPYLIAALDWIIQNAGSVQELILLGDLVDFWTYPPNQQPPNFQVIINANPNIFGPQGKLNDVLTALQGRVSYLNGNHDISLTQNDLNLIANPQGYTITHRGDYYYPLSPSPQIMCMHGHTATFFNAPDHLTKLHMPVGHFVTRAVAYKMQQTLQPGQTVADIADNGAPGFDVGALLKINSNSSLPKAMLEYMRTQTGISPNQQVILPDGTTTTYSTAETLYDALWTQWVQEGASPSGSAADGILYAAKSVYADYDGTFLSWFAQRLAFMQGAWVVATGHTHFARSGLNESLIGYVNSGFMCPAKPDANKKHFNFAVIHLDTLATEVLQVNSQFQVSTDKSVPSDAIVVSPSQDFSCYIIVTNNTAYDWTLTSSPLNNGHWIVRPDTIPAGQVVTFWAQDYAGIHGTDGALMFMNNAPAPTPCVITFDCPTGIYPNLANTTAGTLYAKSGSDTAWGAIGVVPRGGHPLFISVVLT